MALLHKRPTICHVMDALEDDDDCFDYHLEKEFGNCVWNSCVFWKRSRSCSWHVTIWNEHAQAMDEWRNRKRQHISSSPKRQHIWRSPERPHIWRSPERQHVWKSLNRQHIWNATHILYVWNMCWNMWSLEYVAYICVAFHMCCLLRLNTYSTHTVKCHTYEWKSPKRQHMWMKESQ